VSTRKLFIALLLVSTFSIVVAAQTPNSHIKNGNAFFAHEQYERALSEYEKVPANSGPSYSQALYNIGVCYFELWQTDQAIAYFKLAIHSRPQGYPKAAYSLGVALESQQKIDEARSAYTQVTAGDRKGAALFRLGVLSTRENDLKAAIELYRQSVEMDGPHRSSAHNNLGVMLAQSGSLSEAEEQFAIAVKQTNGAFAAAVHNLKLCRSLQQTTALNQLLLVNDSTQVEKANLWKQKPMTHSLF
jgi:tetratricopeptide (TPR) repeat protein